MPGSGPTVRRLSSGPHIVASSSLVTFPSCCVSREGEGDSPFLDARPGERSCAGDLAILAVIEHDAWIRCWVCIVASRPTSRTTSRAAGRSQLRRHYHWIASCRRLESEANIVDLRPRVPHGAPLVYSQGSSEPGRTSLRGGPDHGPAQQRTIETEGMVT